MVCLLITNFGMLKLSAQIPDNRPVEITMEDGSVKTGTILLPMDISVKSVKLTTNGKTEKVNFEDVKTITYGSTTYINMAYTDGGNVRKNKKMMLASITEGKVKLYEYTWGASNMRAAYKMQALNTGGTAYYCKRDNEDFATLISLDDGNSANRNSIFKKRAIEYFADNAALMQKIENKEYKFPDIYKVVNEYNRQ